MNQYIKNSFLQNSKKFFRFVKIYGISRTFNKVCGRLRSNKFIKPLFIRNNPFIGLIGCGQFQFSTIAYYLSKGSTNIFAFCYDIDKKKSKSLGNYYSIPKILTEKHDIYNQDNIKLVYIASNHASHTPYAIKFLEKGLNVFCEKPVSVSFEQFDLLINAISKSKGNFYVGYNRPYSPAIADLKKRCDKINNDGGKFTLNCFITAHDLPDDHWYHNPQEGTRICGNVGHWIDLMIHLYNWRGDIPKEHKIHIAYSNLSETDDNITISITSPAGDLTSISISSRSEPFEGINETINFQYKSLIAKIDDFRRISIWNRDKLTKKRYWPKNVGHQRSVMQPFKKDNRDLNEIITSTELMLHITDMVRNAQTEKEITLTRSL